MAAKTLARQIMDRADELARYSEMIVGITRRYGTSVLAGVLDIAEGWFREAGMVTERDAFGSLIGTYAAAEGSTETRPFVIGGHLDSVKDAGRYDGILGVLSGLAVVQSLREEGRRLPFPVQVIAFADEEGLRFNSTLIASRAWAGLGIEKQLQYPDADGVTLAEAMSAFGGDPAFYRDNPAPVILGFIEAHIEQGPVLEREELPVGIVSAIVGSARGEFTIQGMAGHAGTVPMAMRKDALAAAAEIVLAVERIGRETEGLVATVGELDVRPGATNVIPGEVRMTCEVRHASTEVYEGAIAAIRERVGEVCAARGLSFTFREIAGYEPTPMDEGLRASLRQAIEGEGYRPIELTSGAGHDAINVAKIAPAAMLFVRCKDGISHNPAESITTEDAEAAIRVMTRFLDSLGAG
jgi:allantoate deiminase